MTAKLLATMRAHLQRFSRRALRPGARRRAAVALAITPDAEGRACFVLTRRAEKLASHSGQWALPGGRFDAGEDAEAAALRELEEEVGLRFDARDVLGLLDDYPTRSGYLITPVVVGGVRARALRPNPAEVARAYHVPLSELDKPEVPHLWRIPESERPVISMPLLNVQIHAPTAAVLFQLREVAVHGRDTRVAHYEQPVFAWQ